MSETKFTPGPWYAIPKGGNPEEACAMYRIDNRQDAPWENFGQIAYAHKDDAHLMAAAPDMYEELECARDVFRFYQSQHEFKGGTEKAIRNKEIADRIDRLLAKARGQE